MKTLNKGFTLIELLVVIAIIAILASMILVSLEPARKRGRDARIVSGIQQVRNLFEISYDGTNYNCLTAAVDTFATTGNVCDKIGQISTDITNQGGELKVRHAVNNLKTFVVYSKLASDSAKFFCIDYLGNTNPAGAEPAAGATGC